MNKLFHILIFFYSLSLTAQVVNIESMRVQSDSIRFVSINELSTWYEDNNGQYIFSNAISSTNQLRSKNLRHAILLLGNYNTISSFQGNLQSSWLGHLRYSNKLSSEISLETFGQYSGNAILDVSQRILGGLGIRIELASYDNFKFYVGNSYLIEFENNNTSDISLVNHRNNLFISSSLILGDKQVEINNTIYWQPKYNDITNFNILEQLKSSFKIKNNLSLFLLLDYYYDSITPLLRKQYYFSTKFGVSLKI